LPPPKMARLVWKPAKRKSEMPIEVQRVCIFAAEAQVRSGPRCNSSARMSGRTRPVERKSRLLVVQSYAIANRIARPNGAPVVRRLWRESLAQRTSARDYVPSASIANLRPPGSVPLVYKLCQRNEVPSLRTGGALRFHQDAVESFLALNPAPHYAPVEPRCSASSWSIELYPPAACG
jgi:hypothetical protein